MVLALLFTLKVPQPRAHYEVLRKALGPVDPVDQIIPTLLAQKGASRTNDTYNSLLLLLLSRRSGSRQPFALLTFLESFLQVVKLLSVSTSGRPTSERKLSSNLNLSLAR